jgi:hypothetical protein
MQFELNQGSFEMIETVLLEVCSLANKESKYKLSSFRKILEEIHQDSVNRGIGLQAYTLIRIEDACNGFLVQEFNAIWNRIENALLHQSHYSNDLAKIAYEKFISVIPRVEKVTEYFDGMPANTGQPELAVTIQSIREKITDKWNLLALEKKEDARQLAIKIRNNQISVHDRWLRWCKDKPMVFVVYYFFVAIGAINGLVTSYNFISQQITQYLGKP